MMELRDEIAVEVGQAVYGRAVTTEFIWGPCTGCSALIAAANRILSIPEIASALALQKEVDALKLGPSV